MKALNITILTWLFIAFSASITAAPSNAVENDWVLDPAVSYINFSSTKNYTVTEVHQFDRFDITLPASKKIIANIDLSSVNTAIPIRNERMKKLLFKVAQMPSATLTADLPNDAFTSVATTYMDLKAVLSLNGHSQSIPLNLSVTRINDDKVLVSTRKPVLMRASDYGLSNGIAALKAIAGLQHISAVIPVSFQIVLQR